MRTELNNIESLERALSDLDAIAVLMTDVMNRYNLPSDLGRSQYYLEFVIERLENELEEIKFNRFVA
ncbi:hypothetical protein [Cyanobacterium aponinum]|uniref:Uncharacterized protein n=1 Tax=Cyanobacterium aponinum 0216 TaxID=2676140 RepID=A0A844GR37_9CHRO|nr:hypothetical protein [Cyanobacterium aponinum]MTF37541.1 hypothetical protein [Cyanobacterium aponinum 0216]PHV63728.1 hypothetical protein CSQ80_03920 [Cyanobacterium aponinum IPPAS B-1201]